MNLGGINPVLLTPVTPQDTSVASSGLPDIAAIYDKRFAQGLELKKLEGDFQKIQTEAKKADTQAKTEERAVKENKLKPYVSLFEKLISAGQYDAAQQVIDSASADKEVAPMLGNIAGKTFTMGDHEINTSVDQKTGRVLLTNINKKDGTKVWQQTTGLPTSVEAGKAGKPDKVPQNLLERQKYIDSSRDAWTSSVGFKKDAEAKAALNDIYTYAKQVAAGNTAASSQLKTSVSRLNQTGVLSDADIDRATGDPSLRGKLSTWLNMSTSGVIGEKELKEYEKLADALDVSLTDRTNKAYDQYVDSTSAALEQMGVDFDKKKIRAQTGIVVNPLIARIKFGTQNPSQTKPKTQLSGKAADLLNQYNKGKK